MTYAELLSKYTDLLIKYEDLKRKLEMLRALGISIDTESEVPTNAE